MYEKKLKRNLNRYIVKRKNQDTPEKEKANTGGSAKKLKAPKDPLKPKKPMGAYFLYLNEKRASIREEFPELSMTDVSKKASEMYKQLSDKESLFEYCVCCSLFSLKGLYHF